MGETDSSPASVDPDAKVAGLIPGWIWLVSCCRDPCTRLTLRPLDSNGGIAQAPAMRLFVQT